MRKDLEEKERIMHGESDSSDDEFGYHGQGGLP